MTLNDMRFNVPHTNDIKSMRATELDLLRPTFLSKRNMYFEDIICKTIQHVCKSSSFLKWGYHKIDGYNGKSIKLPIVIVISTKNIWLVVYLPL
jgi:hypothetical protein